MPNLDPVPDSAEHLQVQLDAIKRGAAIKVLPYGAITVGEKGERLADMEAMSDKVCAFSDDGKGVQNDEMMREAMTAAKRLGKIIAAHCEDNSLLSEDISTTANTQKRTDTGASRARANISKSNATYVLRRKRAAHIMSATSRQRRALS